MLRIAIPAVFVAAIAFCAPAYADALDDAEKACEGKTGQTPDQIVAGCTTVIQSGQYDQANLSLAYINRGLGYHQKNELDKAIADYEEALKLNPQSAVAFYARGTVYRDKGANELALADLDRAVAIKPDLPDLFATRGNVLAAMGEHERAIADFTEALRVKPGDANALSSRGYSYYKNGEIDLAMLDYDAALAIRPDAIDFLNRGVAHFKLGEHEKSIADYSEALKLQPDYELAVANRCDAYNKIAEFDKAIADCNEAIRLKPDDALAFHDRGVAYRGKHDYVNAIADFDKAFSLDPELTSALFDRAIAYEEQQDFEHAIQDLDRYVGLEPDDASGYMMRGVTLFEKGDFARAVPDFEKQNQLNPQYAYASLWLTIARGKVGDVSAEQIFQSARQVNLQEWPGPLISFSMGQATVDEVRKAASAGDAKTQSEQNCEADFFVGEIELKRGNTSEARTLLQRAVDTCPKTYYEYGGALAEMKRIGGGDIMAMAKGYYDQLASALPAWFPREALPFVIGIVIGGVLVLFLRRRKRAQS